MNNSNILTKLREELTNTLMCVVSDEVGGYWQVDFVPNGRQLIIYKTDKDIYSLFDLDMSVDLSDPEVGKKYLTEQVRPVVTCSHWYMSATLIVKMFIHVLLDNYKGSDFVDIN